MFYPLFKSNFIIYKFKFYCRFQTMRKVKAEKEAEEPNKNREVEVESLKITVRDLTSEDIKK